MMTGHALYDLNPVWRVMAMGLVVATGPVAWVWVRSRSTSPARRLQLLTLFTLFLTFDLVLFGAFTRLTDSGLGCPDWPGCYGSVSPFGATEHISNAQAAMPTGPVTLGKAWVEMIHRYLATGVGVLILVLTLVSWTDRRRVGISPWWPTWTLVWIGLQGAFGALTVTMKLFPAIVTMHLLGGLGLLALLRIQAVKYGEVLQPSIASSLSMQPMAPTLLRLVWAVVVLVVIQVALGGWVSTNYAVLACTDFPMCQGQWWPDMDFHHGFAFWRDLGMTHLGTALPFEALTAIHYTHRLSAYWVLVALGFLAWRMRAHPQYRSAARLLTWIALWQLFTGLSNVVLGWPLIAAVAHTGGAAALVVVLTGLLAQATSSAQADLPKIARQTGCSA
jgi:cytochrome c oxidase assembly protein subunit 15